MIYSLTLETAVIAIGVLLLIVHAIALWRPREMQARLRRFPRSATAGAVLLTIAAVWSWILIKMIDLGEFSNWRTRILIFIPIAALLTWRYVDEFLAARALGMVALLAAEPLLEAAWMRPEMGRLPLVILAYLWIVAALFWIGMPYTLRDQITWVTKNEGRWKSAAFAGIGYGLLLICSFLTLHR
jgi:multisubunit Na+/H+ antiporter MnhG subunit